MQKVHLLPRACALVLGGRRAGIKEGARRRTRNEARSEHCAGVVDSARSGQGTSAAGRTVRQGADAAERKHDGGWREREDEGRRASSGEGRGRELSCPIYRARRRVRSYRGEEKRPVGH
jgi:hypothetical protein